METKKGLPEWLTHFAIPVAVFAGLIGFCLYESIQHFNVREKKAIEDMAFVGCAGGSTDLEFRKACGRYAKAYASGKQDYEAFGKTITWDDEARMYVIKGEH